MDVSLNICCHCGMNYNNLNENTYENEDNKITNILVDEDKEDLFETILILIDEYFFYKICEPNYEVVIFEQIIDIIDEIIEPEFLEDEEITDIIHDAINYYFEYMQLPRSYNRELYFNENDDKIWIEQQLEYLIQIDQSDQKSDEWYKERHKLVTASSAWKALDKENYVNQYIYDKCKPLDLEKYNRVNMNSPFHWGNKYEPVSTSLYEYMYKTEIKEFGCIPHKNHKFMGASPDGINILKDSELYGRLLEIKNIVNREITGIPKKEYWIQMQLQMEVCDLDYCDFLECRFNEYECEEDFNKDGTFNKTINDNYKGIIVQFFDGNRPIYEYAPFQCSKEEFEEWNETCLLKHENDTWIKNIYWKLTEFSCVLVARNKLWFENVVWKFKEVWDTIQYEKIHGYEHRKSVKINKKPPEKENIIFTVNTDML